MTLQQIQYVIEIANYGKISKAANALYLAQPYLSNSLKSLEEELGITIFYRSRKGVELTEEGKEFLSYAKPLIEQQKKISEIYTNKSASSIFQFSLSTQHYSFIIKAFFDFFKDCNPKRYNIHIKERSMYKVIEDIYTKTSDVGIIFMSSYSQAFIKRYLSAKNIEFHHLISIRPTVFFHKNHPMAKHSQINLEEMSEYPFVSFESGTATSDYFAEEVLMQNFNLEQNYIYVKDRGTMINTLTHINAFSIGTGILAEGFAGSDLVSRPILSRFDSDVQLGWIQLTGTNTSQAVCEFLRAVDEVLKDIE